MIRILVPLDGSPAAEESLVHAIAIARVFPAELTLLRVIAESDSGDSVKADSVYFDLWRHQAQAYLDDQIERYATEDLSIHCEVTEGRPAETIIRFAVKTNPDLMVLTRYGRGDAHDFATGGTAQKIVSRAHCSVLLLDPRRQVGAEQSYRRILVPIDESKDTDYAVAVSAMIAEIHDASLLLLHIIDEPRLPNGLPATRHARELIDEVLGLVRHEAERRLRELTANISPRISVDTLVMLSPDTPIAIESTAANDDCDLMLLHTIGNDSDARHQYDAMCQSLILCSNLPLLILRTTASGGQTSNFRSVYLDQPKLQLG